MTEEKKALKLPAWLEAITRFTAMDGRMSRKSFWIYALALIVVHIVIMNVCPKSKNDFLQLFNYVILVWFLNGLFIMLMAPAVVRRIHDSGESASNFFFLSILGPASMALFTMLPRLMIVIDLPSDIAFCFGILTLICVLVAIAAPIILLVRCLWQCCQPAKTGNNPFAKTLTADEAQSHYGAFHVSRGLLWFVWLVNYIIRFCVMMFSDSEEFVLTLIAVTTLISCAAAIGRLRETGKLAFAPLVLAGDIFFFVFVFCGGTGTLVLIYNLADIDTLQLFVHADVLDSVSRLPHMMSVFYGISAMESLALNIIVPGIFFLLQLFSLYLLLQPSSAIVQKRKPSAPNYKNADAQGKRKVSLKIPGKRATVPLKKASQQPQTSVKESEETTQGETEKE